ncbi:MAG: hypothetical protein AAFR71_03030 [Pseudomonadota bacterium]
MAEFGSEGWFDPGHKNAQLIYILFFTAFVLGGVPAIVGVIIAYLNRGKIGGLIDNHYTWLIRTFWIGFLYMFVAALLLGLGVGFLLVLAVIVWTLIRLVKGIQRLNRNQSMPEVTTWLV